MEPGREGRDTNNTTLMWKYWEIGNVLKVIKDRVKGKFWKLPSV